MVNSSSSTSHSEVGCCYSYYSTCLTSCFFFAHWIVSSKRTSCNFTAKNCAWQVVTWGHAELLSFPRKLSSLLTSGSMLLFLPPRRPFPSWCFSSGIRFPRKHSLRWGYVLLSGHLECLMHNSTVTLVILYWMMSVYSHIILNVSVSPYYTENVHVCIPSHAEFCVSPHYTEWCLCVCVPSQ